MAIETLLLVAKVLRPNSNAWVPKAMVWASPGMVVGLTNPAQVNFVILTIVCRSRQFANQSSIVSSIVSNHFAQGTSLYSYIEEYQRLSIHNSSS